MQLFYPNGRGNPIAFGNISTFDRVMHLRRFKKGEKDVLVCPPQEHKYFGWQLVPDNLDWTDFPE